MTTISKYPCVANVVCELCLTIGYMMYTSHGPEDFVWSTMHYEQQKVLFVVQKPIIISLENEKAYTNLQPFLIRVV